MMLLLLLVLMSLLPSPSDGTPLVSGRRTRFECMSGKPKTVDEKLIFYGYELLPAIICQSSGDKKSFRSFVGDFKSWKETPISVVKCMMEAINIKHFSNSRRKRRHVKGEVAKLQWDCVKKLPNTINKHKQKARRCVTESHCETALPDVECLN